MTKKDYKDYNKWVKKLVPYWKKREELMSAFKKNERGLELLMNQEVKPPVELEFFYNDEGGCCGIGGVDYEDRKKFPLIYDGDLRGRNEKPKTFKREE